MFKYLHSFVGKQVDSSFVKNVFSFSRNFLVAVGFMYLNNNNLFVYKNSHLLSSVFSMCLNKGCDDDDDDVESYKISVVE